MNNQILNGIVEFCSGLISNEKIGSRFEANDIKKIWKLGDKIINEINPLNLSVLLPQLHQIHIEKGVRYDNRLYKASVIFRKYWNNESDYLKAAQKLNAWTRLREIFTVCEEILSGESQYSRKDLDKLIEKCENLTYEGMREEVNKFRSRDDYLLKELGLDKYEFSDNFMELHDELQRIVEKNDFELEKNIRENYTSDDLKNMRLILSALQKDEIYNKYVSTLKKINKKMPEKEIEIIKKLNKIFTTLQMIIHNQKIRRIIREQIPITFIGNFSTFIRAIESDSNKEQYKKNKELLTKFLGGLKL